MYYQKTLRNGLRVIGEKILHFRSVSMGIWIGVGSSFETQRKNGISHFIEHMMFKGTRNRTAKEIASIMDGVGGQLNAFTSKECTCYYSKVMDEHLSLAFDVLFDMLMNSIFDEVEIEKEKGVVLEEINMVEDTPEDLVHDLLAQSFFKGHPLSRPILGSPENILSFSQEDLFSFIRNHYIPSNTVISFAGNFDEDMVEELVERYVAFQENTPKRMETTNLPSFNSAVAIREKETEQTHVCLALPGLPMGDDDLYSLLILNNLFGGGMSSRLFQSIREERGLAYSVYSYPSSYRNTGMFTIYAGMKPSQTEQVINLILEEMSHILEHGMEMKEFQQAKEQLKGNYLLGLESTSNRMSAIGKSQLLLNKVLSPQEIIEKIENVRIEDLKKVIYQVFDFNRLSCAVVGKLQKGFDIEKCLGIRSSSNVEG
ncbi:MAG: M16 family metallopeptidase [Clostridia bacterium]|jgi:predicted Zn-dependent peptidase